MRHQDLVLNHKIESWTYANAIARTGASGFVSGDIGRIAYQSDNGTYWRLITIAPAWQSMGELAGVTDGSNAITGMVGEYVTNGTGVGVGLGGSGVVGNITSISLTAGDWDVFGWAGLTGSATGTITITNFLAGVSVTSAAFNGLEFFSAPCASQIIGNIYYQFAVPVTRVSLSATTTVYLVAQGTFSAVTGTGAGAIGRIAARRVR